jgi:Family of unknown function (DUF6088)
MAQSTINKVISRIYGNGRGWSFSQIDLSDLGTRSVIDVALHRLHKKGTIRRVIRGIYDYPRHNKKLGGELSPDIDQVARALARKFGWQIQVTGSAALNLLGLSTQVMGRFAYLSNGPDKTYSIGNQTLVFQHTALKESGFKLRESALIVQALKSLGRERIDEKTIIKLRNYIAPDLCKKVLKDTQTSRGWIHDTILKICQGER